MVIVCQTTLRKCAIPLAQPPSGNFVSLSFYLQTFDFQHLAQTARNTTQHNTTQRVAWHAACLQSQPDEFHA
jgi:hypothetical protein